MKINFFEEFPNEKNLSKLKLITFPSTLYLASKSLDNFLRLKDKIERKYKHIEVAYWPILDKSYWVSPFSYNFELKRLYHDLNKRDKKKRLKIMLDLELPLLNSKLFILNLFSFYKNKKLIKKIFLEQDKLNIVIFTAEYYSINVLHKKFLEWLGVSYSIKKYKHKKIVMFYSSMIRSKYLQNKIRKSLFKMSKNIKGNLYVGLGTITKGIYDKEPILKPNNLEKDLSFCKKESIKNVVIFRLGGLNKNYLKVIEKFK